jgi:hypothetical protein
MFIMYYRGCVTPKVLENVKNFLKGGDEDATVNMDFLEGYDELPDEWKAKIDHALEEGHVADEDWRGVSGSRKVCRAWKPNLIPRRMSN